MRTNGILLLVGVCALLLAGTAWADWSPGDPCKMHYPQLPDPNGWDVYTWGNIGGIASLSDDWMCTSTGPVSDLHFWVSLQDDVGYFTHIFGTVQIWSDVPKGQSVLGYSHPGELLWDRAFEANDVTVRLYGTGDQGWLGDLPTGAYIEHDHQNIYQINITDIADPFMQQDGNVYWITMTFNTAGPGSGWVGWKTTQDGWMDGAVWKQPTGDWQPVVDPITGEALELAFVITPEPATLTVLALGAAAILRRRSRRSCLP